MSSRGPYCWAAKLLLHSVATVAVGGTDRIDDLRKQVVCHPPACLEAQIHLKMVLVIGQALVVARANLLFIVLSPVDFIVFSHYRKVLAGCTHTSRRAFLKQDLRGPSNVFPFWAWYGFRVRIATRTTKKVLHWRV